MPASGPVVPPSPSAPSTHLPTPAPSGQDTTANAPLSAPHKPLEGPPTGERELEARGGLRLLVQWWTQDQGQQVRLTLRQLSGPGMAVSYDALMGLQPPLPRQGTWPFGPPPPRQLELNLWLREVPAVPLGGTPRVELWVNLPVTSNEMVNQVIGEWPLAPVPERPLPVDDPVLVEEVAAGQDLFNTCWLQPLGVAELNALALRGMTAAMPGDLPLYQSLALCTGTPEEVAQARRELADTFLRGGAPNLSSVDELHAPTRSFAAWYPSLMQAIGTPASGVISLKAQLALVTPALAPALSVSEYLASPDTLADTAALWQTVMALALSGTAAQGLLATNLVNTLRIQHYLQTLQAEWTEQGDTPIGSDAVALPPPSSLRIASIRREVLQATPGLGDDAAAWALNGTVPASGTGITVPGNRWRLLGVGQLALARQQPLGYALGELAEVVNVLPRERQERSERSIHNEEETQQEHQRQQRQQQQRRHADASNELADALKAEFHSQGDLTNLSDLSQTYSNPNLVLSGTAAEGLARLEALMDQQKRMLQRSGEQAAQTVAEQVHQQRHEVRRHWLEQQASRCIDNSTGVRMVGVYRWVDRLLSLQLQPQGARLVLAFDVLQPAQSWVSQLAAQGPVPLEAPPTPEQLTPPVTCYSVIQPDNYQSLGAAYGLSDLPPPPPAQISLSLQVLPSSAGQSLLQVPRGYEATRGTANLALGDQNCNAVASVADQVLSPVGSTTVAQLSLSQAVPSTSASSVGPLAVDLPGTPLALLPTAQPLTFTPPLTGAVPVTVLSDAGLYILSITLACERIGLNDTSQPDQLLTAWQLQVYNRLQEAWRQGSRTYSAELALRIQQASTGCIDAIQRQTLQAACLATLGQASATGDPAMLTGGLDWAAMSWHYETDAGALGGPLPDSPDAAINTVHPTQAPAAQQQFERFLKAAAARVLVPVHPAQQTALLFALQWQAQWPSPSVLQPQMSLAVPVSLGAAPFIVEQVHAPVPTARPPWVVRLPTTKMYLQSSDQLPSWPAPTPHGVAP